MGTFRYTAIDGTGKKRSGTLEAEGAAHANAMILAWDMIPRHVEQVKKKELSGFAKSHGGRKRVTSADLIIFTKQLRTLIRAGVPVVKALQTLENQTGSERFKEAIRQITVDIERGKSLHEAFGVHKGIFSSLYLAMIQAGESSGSLPEVLDRLIYIVEHEVKVKSDIRSALNYPIFVVVFLSIAFFVLLTFVVPTFVGIFKSAGVALPLPTRICMHMYEGLTAYWPYLLLLAIGTVVFLNFYLRTDNGRYNRDLFLMKIPLVGEVFIKSAMSRFASIFAILQSSGIQVLQSMDILTGTIGNAVIAAEFSEIRDSMEKGQGIAGPLAHSRHFTPMVVNMVAVGEESGRLDDMLREVAVHYDEEVEYAVKRLTSAITPILTVGLAAVVLFFALAIFLPMWDMAGTQLR